MNQDQVQKLKINLFEMEMDRLQKEMEKKDKQEEVGQVQDEKMMAQDGLEEMDNHEEVEKMYK